MEQTHKERKVEKKGNVLRSKVTQHITEKPEKTWAGDGICSPNSYLVMEGDNGSNCRFLGDEKPVFGYIPDNSSPIV